MNIRCRNLKSAFCLLLASLSTQLASAQYVYKIKADTVRIYNTCDSSAELVLQNRTQNVQGFLYNKGQGVTEFRSLTDNFIQNQGLVAQPANFNISGFGNVGGVLNVAGGYVNLNNPNGNFILMGGGGVAGPALVKRSAGTRIVLYPSMNAGPAFMDHAIGMESGHIWLATATNDTANGFKFYGGITPIGQIDGKGSPEWAGMGRFKGWYTSGTGQGLETGVLGGAGVVQAYDRSAGTYLPLVLTGGGASLRSLTIDGTGFQLNAFGNQKLLATDANGYIVDGSSNFLAWRQRVQPDLNTLDTDVGDVSGSYFLTSFQPQNGIPHNNYGVYNFFRLSGDGLYKGIIAFGTNDGSIYTRRKANGIWDSTWRAVWDSGNKLGIANQTTTQTQANFNIDGSGTVGGTFSVVNGNAGIGTTSPSNYGYGIGTNNRFLEVLNPNTTANSMSEVVLSTGATVPGCIGSLIWAAKNTAYNPIKGAAYIAAYLDTSAAQKVRADMTFATADDSLPLERLRITNKGLIGIYNPFPKYRLDVNGAGHFTGGVYSNSGFLTTMTTTSSGTVHYQIRTGGEKLRWAIGTQVVETDTTTNNGSDFTIFRYNTDGTFLTNADFVINRNTGYTGIGTRTPTNKLDIATGGGAGLRVRANTTGTAIFSSHVVDLQSSNYTGGLAFTVPANGTGELQAYTSTTESGNILLNPNGGSIIVGSTAISSAYKLDVNGQGHFQNAIIGSGVSGFYQDGNNGAYRAFGAMSSTTNRGFFLQDSAGSVSTMYVGLTGTYARKVGINTTAPAVALDVAGDIHASGAITAPSISQTSLRSLKKDIKPFTASALNILDSAQVRTFIFKADTTNTTRIGFIADEVPDAMASTGRKGVEETNTVALLVKAIQEMKAEVEALQQHVHELEAQLKEKNK